VGFEPHQIQRIRIARPVLHKEQSRRTYDVAPKQAGQAATAQPAQKLAL
jgi:hypothetical protein